MNSKNSVLILAPHTDDAELGCGATMARMIEEGKEVYVAVFSTAEESLPEGMPPGTLKEEFYRAMDTMGIPKTHLFLYNYPVRKFSYFRQEILEDLVDLRKRVHPDVVFLPCSSDVHQDHEVIYMEGIRAFKKTTILGYELPWNHLFSSVNTYIVINHEHLKRKWAALRCYKTQFSLHRSYFSWDIIESLAKVRGVQVGSLYAEAFQVIRFMYPLEEEVGRL